MMFPQGSDRFAATQAAGRFTKGYREYAKGYGDFADRHANIDEGFAKMHDGFPDWDRVVAEVSADMEQHLARKTRMLRIMLTVLMVMHLIVMLVELPPVSWRVWLGRVG